MAIYFDMDGVMADFALGVKRAGGVYVSPETRDEKMDDAMWDAVRSVPHFYLKLPEIRSGTNLFRAMKAAGMGPEVLTAIPKAHRNIDDAAEDKIAWNEAHLGSGVKTHICYRAEKVLRCRGPADILFDDHADTIQEWRAAGGTGCLVREGSPIIVPPRIAMELKLAEMPDDPFRPEAEYPL